MKRKTDNPLIHFENKWVALTQDRKRVIAAGDSIKEVNQKLKQLKDQNVILTHVLPFDKIYSP